MTTRRLMLTASADIVAAFDGGRLVDFGAPGDLLARGGLYSELYKLQVQACSANPRPRKPVEGGAAT